MQRQRSIQFGRSNPDPSIRSAAVYAAQSRLMLLRVAERIDPLLVPTLLDLAGVLQYLVVSIEELERRTR
jgi:hypothetical protein